MRSLLSRSRVYGLFRSLVGGTSLDRVLVSEYLRPKANARLLDIGCGPALILDSLPETVQYVGFDPHERYVEAARTRYEGRGSFVHGYARPDTVAHLEPFDGVLALGVLHHLNDEEALELLSVARMKLKPGGSLVTLDGCFEARQTIVARLLLRSDRGGHIRDAASYISLAQTVFEDIKAQTRSDLLHVPYSHLIMKCTKPDPNAANAERDRACRAPRNPAHETDASGLEHAPGEMPLFSPFAPDTE